MTDDVERTVTIPRWEYLNQLVGSGQISQEMGLNTLGEQGWELVSLDWDTGRAVFKRVAGLMELKT